MRGHTTKPCPGCGRPDTYRPTHGVCSRCAEDIERANRLREGREALGEERVCRLVPEVSWEMPYICHAKSEFGQQPNLLKRFHELVLLLGEYHIGPRLPEDATLIVPPDKKGIGSSNYARYHPRVFHRPVAEALEALYERIRVDLEHAHAEGEKRGRSFVAALVRGEVSPQQLDNLKDTNT